jgi:hypothetical protein
MPNIIRILSPYIPGGNPNTMAVPLSGQTAGDYTNYAPGQLGGSFDLNGSTYTLVQVNAGETIVAGQLLYWLNKASAIVTGALASANRNQVSGISMVAITGANNPSGTLIAMLVKGASIPVTCSATAIAAGNLAEASATSGEIDGVVAGTAPGYVKVGIITGAASGGLCPVDVDLDTLP